MSESEGNFFNGDGVWSNPDTVVRFNLGHGEIICAYLTEAGKSFLQSVSNTIPASDVSGLFFLHVVSGDIIFLNNNLTPYDSGSRNQSIEHPSSES